MKKITQNLRWLVTLLTMIVSVGAWAEETTVLWQEDFSSYAKDAVPSGGTYSYVCTNGGSTTKIYTEALAGGESPELLVSKGGGTFTATIPLNNVEGDLTLTFTTNKQEITVSTTTEGITGSLKEKQEGTHTCTFTGVTTSMTEIVIVFTGSGSSNVRLDDIQLVKGTPIVSSITVNPATVNATAEGADGTLAISYENLNISSTADFGIQYYDANNEEIDKPDWIVVEVESEEAGVSYMISYVIDANEGEARTAYCKVFAMDDEDFIYSNLITINQAEYVAPSIATLPFVFDGGRDDIEDTEGLTQEGLGSDYSSAPKLKFDNTGDWVLLQFDETPGNLSFDIKGNSFSGGTFTVQTSTDGKTYTNLETYTELGDTQTKTFENLSSDVRYIKWIYTNKVSGNVGLGNIALAEYGEPEPSITVSPTTINVLAAGGDGTIDVTFTAFEPFSTDIQFYESDGTTETESGDWLYVEIDETTGNVNYLIEENTGEARTAYFKVYGLDEEMNELYSELITITQDEFVEPHEELTFVKVTSTDELVAGGEYIIIANYPEDSEGYYAMTTTQNTNNRGADGIYVSEDIAYIEPEHVQVITLEGNSEGWYFNTGDGYLYAASNSSNHLKTEPAPDENNNAKATIGISSDGDATIVFQGKNSRNNLRFNNNNILFSCYAETSELPLVQLYKKVVEEENITIGSAGYATYVTKKAIKINPHINAYAVLAINETKTSVALDKLTEVPASTPIIVEGAEGEYPCTVIENAESPATNLLKVSTGVTGDGATFYALANKDQGVGFYPVGNGIEVPAGKAYLEIPPTMSVKGFLALGGVADAINNIAVENANGTIFNIAGQKVQNITKGGLYIVNGKKVVVK